MENSQNFFEDIFMEDKQTLRKGPPNRMNDLSYTDWMKFQKSFFYYVSSQHLVEECIYFFTKSLWTEAEPSCSLIVGFKDFDEAAIFSPRMIDTYPNVKSLSDINIVLRDLITNNKKYDFILIDLRPLITDFKTLSTYLNNYEQEMYESIGNLLVKNRYLGMLVGMESSGGAGFPLPWVVANSGRKYLKLCDEKIGLIKSKDEVFYCLFSRNERDEIPVSQIRLDKICLGHTDINIPAFIFPKPPPRKKDELLHPAKFPETLISEYINIFTEPGDSVFDPMAGTGSTLIAAVRSNRDGFGLELKEEFVKIAQNRLVKENAPRLFSESGVGPNSHVYIGDATKLEQVTELVGKKFNYIVTSPPYWSMLNNPGSEGQRARRAKNLPLVYSDDERDLGNIKKYDVFVEKLVAVYQDLSEYLVDGGILTIIVKNVKRNQIQHTLAWDIIGRLCEEEGKYEYLGTTLWCQDDIGMKPFAVGIYWVSNTVHQYCLHLRKIPTLP